MGDQLRRRKDRIIHRVLSMGKYTVDHEGRIFDMDPRNCGRHAPRLVSVRRTPRGYCVCKLRVPGGTAVDAQVHRVVMIAFHGLPPADRRDVNHRDGVKHNNRPANLEWCSQGQNVRHAWRTGLCSTRHLQGSNNPASVLSSRDVSEIRRRYRPHSHTNGGRQLAREFGINKTTVRKILNGTLWNTDNQQESQCAS